MAPPRTVRPRRPPALAVVIRRGAGRRLGFLGMTIGALVLGAPALRAQVPTTNWITAGTGTFSSGANWSSGVPSSGVDAIITNGTLATPTIVNLSGSGSMANLQMGGFDTLNLTLGSTLSVYGSQIATAGALNVNAGSANNTVLGLNLSVTLSGAGTLTLNSGDNNGQAYVQEAGSGITLTNQTSTVQGYGVIGNGGLAFVNQGTVNANVTGQSLTLNGSGGVTNSGVLEATGGGVLNLALGGTLANTGGVIQAAAGSTVNIGNNTTISGGTLTSASTGVLQTSGNAYLAGIRLSSGSTYTGGLGSFTGVSGAIINVGNLQLNAGSANNTILGLTADTTLSFAGTVTLNSGDNNGQAYIQQQSGGLTLTNVDNTIQGYGVIGNGGLAFINQGIVNANVAGKTLTLNGGGGVTNTTMLEATGGGVLNLATGGTLANAGGTILAAAGSTVNIGNGTTISGGTLASAGTGVLQSSGNANLAGVTLFAGSTYTGGLGTTTNLSGTITNNGNFQINAGSANNTVLGLVGNTTLTGGGTVTLNSGDTNGLAYIQQQSGGLTLTNGNNTIQGYGVIGNGGLAFVNQGTVNANVPNQALTVNASGGATNTSLLEATNGGTLVISTTVNNQGGALFATGGTVNVVNGGSILGGTLSGPGLETTAAATLDGSTGNGAVTLAAGGIWTGGLNTQTYVNGSIINQGTIKLNAGSATNTYFGLIGNTTLSGGGIVSLNSGDDNGQVFIQQQSGGLTLTNVDNTIQGYGVIGNGGLTLVNEAGVNANVAGRTLTLNGGGGITNASGLLEASSGGTLVIGTTINNQGGTISANGGVVNVVGGSAIQGGTLMGPTLETTGTAVLDGSTAGGAVTLAPGSVWTSALGTTTYVNGSIANQGAIDVVAGSANNTFLNLTANTTLTGGGVVSLNSGDNNGRAFIAQAAGGLTLTNVDNLIHGYGIIGNGGLTFVNGAAGSVFADIPGQTLQINGTGGFTNNGTLLVASGATLQVSGDLPNNGTMSILADPTGAGTLTLSGNYLEGAGGNLVDIIGSPYLGHFAVAGNLTLDGTLTVGLASGFTPSVGNTFTVINYTGTVAGTFANVIGSGNTLWSVLYNPGQIAVQFNGFQAIPEPAEWLYLLTALPLVLALPRLRRKSRGPEAEPSSRP